MKIKCQMTQNGHQIGGGAPVLMLAPWGRGKQKNKKNEIGSKMDVVEALHTEFLH